MDDEPERDDEGFRGVARSGRRPAVSSTRDRGRERERERERVQARHEGPAWEQGRRFEAYPEIRTRVGMPALPRIAVLAAALAVAAIALFFLPALLGIGGGNDDPAASPSPTAAVATATPEPTPIPEPTPQLYVIKEGDTLSGIARQFGLTLDELLAANEETIENPDRIAVGDEIIIPVPPPDEIDGGEASPEP
jgi:LysM repeat protein